MPSTTRMARPFAHDLGVDSLAIDAVGDLGELVADGSVVGLDRRRDVDAEDPRPQAPEAAQRAEAAALGGGGVDGAAPVGSTPSWEAVSANGRPSAVNVTGVLFSAAARAESSRTAWSLGHPADIDAGDRGAGGELGPRARKGEARRAPRAAEDHRQEDGPAQGNPAGGLAHAGAVDRRVAAHRTEDSS